jgi:hypothetical protein
MLLLLPLPPPSLTTSRRFSSRMLALLDLWSVGAESSPDTN